MGADLDIIIEGQSGGANQTGTGLRIFEYGFFAPDAENRYAIAEDEKSAERTELRGMLFTASYPEAGKTMTAEEQITSMPILERPPEYTRGLYDEVGAESSDMLFQVFFIIAAGCAAFAAARLWNRYKRKKAERCISISQ